jgi:hypothetical protein
MLEVISDSLEEIEAEISKIDGIIRVRIIK